MGKVCTYIHRLQITDFKSFKGQNFFQLGHPDQKDKGRYRLPQCTVFLGDNGTGKTNLLKIIANIEPVQLPVQDLPSQPSDKAYSDIQDLKIDFEAKIGNQILHSPQETCNVSYRPNVKERYKDKKYQAHCQYTVCEEPVHKLADHLFSPLSTLVEWKGQTIHVAKTIGYSHNANFVVDDEAALENVVIYGYGVNRFADTQRNMGSESTCDTLFYNDKPLLNFEEWLLQLDIACRDETQGDRAKRRVRQIKKILQDSNLLPGVTDYRVHVDDQLHSSILFATEYGELTYRDLGYGYQCMMAWVFDFIKKMFDRYPESENPLHEPAILLVDEIDLHLHPHWQRHVLRDLCLLFPATQIIVSTHSPLVIQSVSSMNLFLLTNEEGRTAVKEYGARTFQGWTVEEILHELMCLEKDTRSEEYQDLRMKFENALNTNNVKEGLEHYQKLKEMLHPSSLEADLLNMDMNMLKAGEE